MISSNKLSFEVGESKWNGFAGTLPHKIFRVGTCRGQFGCVGDSYYIISVLNDSKGNGHLNDVFEWFDASCKRDNKNLIVLECMNEGFYQHLIEKRGFSALDKDKDNCIKIFNQKAYKRLMKKGNAILSKGDLKCI